MIKDARLISIKGPECASKMVRPTKHHEEIDNGIAGEEPDAIKERE